MSGTLFICCSCDEHYGGDALACARAIASGTTTPCACECHRAKQDGEAFAVLQEQFKVACERSQKHKDHLDRWRAEIRDAISLINISCAESAVRKLEKLLGEA